VGARTAAAVAALTVGCFIAGTGVSVADPDTSPAPPAPAQDHAAAGVADAPPQPGPQTMDHDGTFAVGSEILPGVYASGGPLPDDTCYWRRIGADNVTVENALSKQPQVVQIAATDIAFKTNGCQPWQLTGGAPPNQNPPWLSQLQLRHSLDILNGLAGQSGNGQLPPY
jgi:hypothetical protein